MTEVLSALDDLPEELAPRLRDLLLQSPEDRAAALRKLFEELSGE